MSGTSYLSFSQWFIAAERPPHLVCTQVTEALTDGYRDMCLVGGMPDYVFTEGIQNNHEGFGLREDVADVPVGATVRLYYEMADMPDGYHALRITTPWWGDNAED